MAGVIALMIASAANADTLEAALQRGDAAAARAALEAEIAGKPDAETHRAHLEGLIAMRQGHLRKAEAMFRAILAEHTGFEPAQVQLVIVLNQLGDPAARKETRLLAETTKDARLRERLARPAGAKKRSDKSGVLLRFSILPSSNLTEGPKAETVIIGGVPFQLDPGSREAAGTGLSFGLVAWKDWTLGRDWQLTLVGSVDRRLYDVDAKPNETEVGARLTLAHKADWGGFSFGPRGALLFQSDALVRRQIGLGFETVVLSGKKTKFSLSAELLRQTFPQASYRDGNLFRGVIGFKWAPNPDAMLFINLPMEREIAAAEHLSHFDLGIDVGVIFRRGPMEIGLSVASSRDRYDGVYPGFDIARKDKVSSLKLSLSHERISWQGMVPELTVTRTRRNSTIPLHDSWSTDVGFNLIKRF